MRPAFFLKLFTVFFGSHSCIFLKKMRKVRSIVDANLFRNLINLQVGISQKFFCFFCLFLVDGGNNGISSLFLKCPA